MNASIRDSTWLSLKFLSSTISASRINTGRFNFSLRPNNSIEDINSTTTYGTGTHKVAGVVTSSYAKLFVNGTLQGVTSTIEAFNPLINDVLIGQLRTLPDNGLRNSLNQALIFQTALSDGECIALTS